jgi:hypothetical protein
MRQAGRAMHDVTLDVDVDCVPSSVQQKNGSFMHAYEASKNNCLGVQKRKEMRNT